MEGLSRVGFVMDRPPQEVFTDITVAKDYYLTQYALAPIVLALDSAQTEYVVGSFRSTTIEERVLPGFKPVRDWGDGVILFRRLD